ncbi:unnamed protein product [Durusdinium trenchii]|uniref:Carbohydrate kinase PfkB domain-containing protein n=2 Tax=Durusdinium trenchii TaxID=1381693 RepID=A0ABP0P183_9DINO
MARLGTSFRLVSAVSAGLWHLQGRPLYHSDTKSCISTSRTRSASACQTVRRPCVAVCGDIFMDIMAPIKKLPVWDSDVEAESVKMVPGGSALNQGRQLHSLGVPVRFVGAVGKDAIGHALLEQVSGQGFPTDSIKTFSNLPSSVCIVLSGPADRAFVSCYSTTDAFTERDLQEQAHKLEDCTHFHLGGYFNMKGLQSHDFTQFVADAKRSKQWTISLNSQACSNGHWCGEDNHLASFLDHVDLLFVNASEGEHICAALCPDSDRSISALCKRYPELMVVITQGSHGCTAYRHQMPAVYVPAKQTRVVDTTGAGDAFIAGFLSSWLPHAAPKRSEAEQKAIVDACKKGHAVASVVLGREGACVEPVRPRDLKDLE